MLNPDRISCKSATFLFNLEMSGTKKYKELYRHQQEIWLGLP